MPIKVKSRGNETAEQMLRRFKKLCEKEGLTKDVKKRQYYEKPSERKRREARRPLPPGLMRPGMRSGGSSRGGSSSGFGGGRGS
jgi:small subunit ribosomal protein S21